MENEILRTVLTEILDELKIIREENMTKEKSVSELKLLMQSLEERALSAKVKIPEMDIFPLQTELKQHYEKLQSIIGELPKNVVHKKQILLFPEFGAREYYRLVFGRLIFWLFITLCATYLYSLGKHFIDNWKDVKKKQYEIIQLQNKSENTLKLVPKRKL